jgi:hypothetical protein
VPTPPRETLTPVSDARFAMMDAAGVDLQVLSATQDAERILDTNAQRRYHRDPHELMRLAARAQWHEHPPSDLAAWLAAHGAGL